jgi:hypothetical protein
MSLSDKAKSMIDQALRTDGIEDHPDALLANWIVVAEFSGDDSDWVRTYSDGLTSISHKIGLLRVGQLSIEEPDHND